ncbi:RNA ligase family protein [Paenibacillus aceris]|uniref:Bifunctional non-homologous end joining protein LigD n=1 Tax=Paenibacillus aceris TaxID=869555 RepID=A0ABS4I2X4_9BACL|nr:RNA ligase family protein [Paenibacillus aceris]MBP1965262.1 bifunctional non-homologous end joining protein LigD [Paenibacillus aceris]NHW35945.1 DNA ligase [Paenibacillus aceris]
MLFSAIKPMNVSVGKEPFDDDQFIFEPKWDGFRILLHKQGSRIEAYSRSGRAVTSKFPELQDALTAIKAHTAILDCEGIVLRGGRPVFDDFSYRDRISQSGKISSAVHTHPATFVVFDLLYSVREHLKDPLMERKQRLIDIVDSTPVLMPTMFVEGQGKALFELMKERNMEGIVAKRKRSIYVPGARSEEWLKVKYVKSIDVEILGYRMDPFELVIGLNFRTVKHKPVGVVEAGITPSDKELFLTLAAPLCTVKEGNTQWIEPRICCRIDYLDRSDMHQLGTTKFRGFLLDKRPEDCVWVG